GVREAGGPLVHLPLGRPRRPSRRRDTCRDRPAYDELVAPGVVDAMTRRNPNMRRVIRVLIAASAVLALAGCFNPFNPNILTERVTSVAPSPSTPQNAVRLFEWCWKNRGIDKYRELFTADYEFLSGGLDSAGNQTREIQARRDDEVQTAENMFIGSAERAPAAKITLDFDRNLIPFPDTRAGKTPKWHQTVRTSVNLKVDID